MCLYVPHEIWCLNLHKHILLIINKLAWQHHKQQLIHHFLICSVCKACLNNTITEHISNTFSQILNRGSRILYLFIWQCYSGYDSAASFVACVYSLVHVPLEYKADSYCLYRHDLSHVQTIHILSPFRIKGQPFLKESSSKACSVGKALEA